MSFYLAMYFLRIWLSGIIAIANRNGDIASSWNIPLWIFTSMFCSPAIYSTIQVSMVFSIHCMISSSIWYILRQCNTQYWENSFIFSCNYFYTNVSWWSLIELWKTAKLLDYSQYSGQLKKRCCSMVLTHSPISGHLIQVQYLQLVSLPRSCSIVLFFVVVLVFWEILGICLSLRFFYFLQLLFSVYVDYYN